MSSEKGEFTFATCQAHNTVPVSKAICGYLSATIKFPVRFIEDLPWQHAYHGILTGTVDMGWICGWPYTQLVDKGEASISLLAAPVMAGIRYQNRPIYFSDVIVRNDSPYHHFSDLRGAAWAYNEPGSQSGYHITRYFLSQMGEGRNYFGRVLESGAHMHSIEMVLDGEVDASAIDSTVLEWEFEKNPSLAKQIRILEVLGPSPSPPIVISTLMPKMHARSLRKAISMINQSPEGYLALDAGKISRLEIVNDMAYDPIRYMSAKSAGITL